ncbi:MAG: type I 3-dehydroquinate dehydratase, partial [Pyrinomonadaceae bacterium]
MIRKLFEQSGRNAIVVIPACARSVTGLVETIERTAERADVVEVRLDYLPASEIYAGARLALESVFSVPLLLTLRPVAQGGEIDLDLAARREFWSTLSNHNSFFDWELDLAESFTVSGPSLDWDRIVCSYHHFQGVPSDLAAIFQRMMLTPALILKLAVMAGEITDCLPVLNCLDHARYAKRELIAIAMGEAGLLTRLLGAAWGSRVTYAAAEANCATAPGQLTVAELLDQFRVKNVNVDTQVFGIIGKTVSHSLSPAIHGAALANTGVDGVYIPLPVEKCGAFLRRVVHP